MDQASFISSHPTEPRQIQSTPTPYNYLLKENCYRRFQSGRYSYDALFGYQLRTNGCYSVFSICLTYHSYLHDHIAVYTSLHLVAITDTKQTKERAWFHTSVYTFKEFQSSTDRWQSKLPEMLKQLSLFLAIIETSVEPIERSFQFKKCIF